MCLMSDEKRHYDQMTIFVYFLHHSLPTDDYFWITGRSEFNVMESISDPTRNCSLFDPLGNDYKLLVNLKK